MTLVSFSTSIHPKLSLPTSGAEPTGIITLAHTLLIHGRTCFPILAILNMDVKEAQSDPFTPR